MRRIICGTAYALLAIASFACRQNGSPPSEPPEEQGIQGIQVATDAYVAYQHADCETVYRLTQPDLLDAMQATEIRYSMRLVRGFCQELDGDQPTARTTYRQVMKDSPHSFAAADARERIRLLDRIGDEPDFLRRVERAAQGPRGTSEPREPSDRQPALYPPLARAAGIEGFAVVEFGIDRRGQTLDPIIVDAEPPFLFEATALRAVRDWEYKSKRSADESQRHVIRIAFRTAVEPVSLEDPNADPAAPPEAQEDGEGAGAGTSSE